MGDCDSPSRCTISFVRGIGCAHKHPPESELPTVRLTLVPAAATVSDKLSMMNTTRQDREREFHNRSFGEHSRQGLEGVYAILHDSRIFYEQFLAERCRDKDVLEYGCGPGS